MSNPTGKGGFVKGHQLSKGIGRPKKHELIKMLESFKSLDSIPSDTLRAIAFKESETLKQSSIPLSQITVQVITIACGVLFQRGL